MNPQTQEATTDRDDMALFRDGIAQAASHPLAPKPAVQALRAAARLIERLQADVQALQASVQELQGKTALMPPGVNWPTITPQQLGSAA